MPRYDSVAPDRQLPNRRQPKQEEVAITADIPADVRRQLTIACAVHGVKLKAAVTEALTDWLKRYPPTV